jgi:hypothetical protein
VDRLAAGAARPLRQGDGGSFGTVAGAFAATNRMSEHLDDLLDEFLNASREQEDPRAAGAYAIAASNIAVAAEIGRVAFWLKYLGNGDAATPMGAIEALSAHLGEKLDLVASALSEMG